MLTVIVNSTWLSLWREDEFGMWPCLLLQPISISLITTISIRSGVVVFMYMDESLSHSLSLSQCVYVSSIHYFSAHFRQSSKSFKMLILAVLANYSAIKYFTKWNSSARVHLTRITGINDTASLPMIWTKKWIHFERQIFLRNFGTISFLEESQNNNWRQSLWFENLFHN